MVGCPPCAIPMVGASPVSVIVVSVLATGVGGRLGAGKLLGASAGVRVRSPTILRKDSSDEKMSP